jgi:hypothetical protein
MIVSILFHSVWPVKLRRSLAQFHFDCNLCEITN